MLTTASPRPVFAALHTSEVTQSQVNESKAAFKCYLQIQLSEKRECVIVDYTHTYTVYIQCRTYQYLGLFPVLFLQFPCGPVITCTCLDTWIINIQNWARHLAQTELYRPMWALSDYHNNILTCVHYIYLPATAAHSTKASVASSASSWATAFASTTNFIIVVFIIGSMEEFGGFFITH